MRGHVGKRDGVRGASWFYSIPLGRDPITGKKKYRMRRGFRTRKLAERAMNTAIHDLGEGTLADPARMSLGELLERWMRDYVAHNVRSRTAQGYGTIVYGHLIPRMGHLRLSRLTPLHVQGYCTDALSGGRRDGKPGGLSPQTIRHHRKVLSKALKQGVQWGLISRNPCENVTPPRVPRYNPPMAHADEVNAILEEARNTRWYPLVHMAIYTGLRRSELLGLRWRDVNLAEGRLSVVQRLVYVYGEGYNIEEPKADASRRPLSLTEVTVNVLRCHRERQEAGREGLGMEWDESALVFSRLDGTPLFPDSFSKAFRRIATRAGVDMSLHGARHSHASILLSAGIPAKVVQERLGHANIGTTMDIYSHVLPELQEEAAQRFEQELRG